jgi:orotate phosphoribosyltransferase-like protein
LLSRYKNKNILIFDEDINSGGTLRMAINALSEQTGDPSNKGVMCLCNAYSKAGY